MSDHPNQCEDKTTRRKWDSQSSCPLGAAWSGCCLYKSPRSKYQAQRWPHQMPEIQQNGLRPSQAAEIFPGCDWGIWHLTLEHCLVTACSVDLPKWFENGDHFSLFWSTIEYTWQAFLPIKFGTVVCDIVFDFQFLCLGLGNYIIALVDHSHTGLIKYGGAGHDNSQSESTWSCSTLICVALWRKDLSHFVSIFILVCHTVCF